MDLESVFSGPLSSGSGAKDGVSVWQAEVALRLSEWRPRVHKIHGVVLYVLTPLSPPPPPPFCVFSPGFLRKVYGILTAQLVLTVVVAATCMMVPPVKDLILMRYTT